MSIVVSLRMRNFDELQSVLASGRTVSHAEMEARYLPARADYDQMMAWLNAQGLATTLTDQNHTNVFVRGPVSAVAAALDVSFARVATQTGEFTSAITAPALPNAFAETVLGVEGLQPHLQLQPPTTTAADSAFVHPTRVIPADVLAAYHVPAGFDGTGQVIAIVAGDVPSNTDLATFYQMAGLTKTPAPLVIVPVNGGPLTTDLSNEASMDTEWASAIAPGAQVMLYATPTYSIPNLLAACVQIMNDGKAKIVSHSASGIESQYAPATLLGNSQVFAQMAAAGITVLHGCGDSGTTGVPVYPASDPFVTALGGTTLSFDANWATSGEVVWPNTGGGISSVFARPAWQTGPGMPTGTMRCVPDAASLSSTSTTTGTTFPLTVHDGVARGVGGDSLTGPVWAGLVAILNQARAAAGLPNVGFLSPRLYPLIGTAALHDITSGSNGGFTAGAGYDLCSGVGSPNVAALIAALTESDPPSIAGQPMSQRVTDGGTVVLSVRATGAPAPTYQWYHDTLAVAGATRSMLVLHADSTTAGDYLCVATNASGAATSAPATVTLAAAAERSRLINLSVMTDVTALGPNFTMGTVISGASGTKPILVRAAGPSLVPFGVTGALADPTVEAYAGSNLIAANNDWGGTADLRSTFTLTGAFGFVSATSADAALYLPALTPRDYTARVSGVGGATGTALAELYDASPRPIAADAPRLINLSVLKRLGGTETVTAGFVIGGTAAETVLVRAIGPQLGQPPFNLGGVMPDPQLTLFGHNSVHLAGSDNWGGDPQLQAVQQRVGAFGVTDAASKDAMLLITLQPGDYTVQVNDVTGTGGLVIVEVYEVP